MRSLQLRAPCPVTGHKFASPPSSQPSHLRASCSYSLPTLAFIRRKTLPRLVCSTARCQRYPTCFLGRKDEHKDGDEVPARNAVEEAMQFLRKGPSVHDMLRKQLEDRELGGGGGSGRDWRSGGGDSGDGGGGFSAQMNELLQVVLATISFMLVYIYLIRREEMTRLSRDYVKYLFGGKPSPRLRRAMDAWRGFFQRIRGKGAEEPSEDAADSSPTW